MQPALAVAIALPGSVVLGLLFLLVGAAATFLMYRLWGYPYDKVARKSSAPRWAMWLHRGLGYLFVAIYLVMMWKMVPRLWTYQVELPPRTVIHVLLAVTVGFLLVVKVAVMRFFRHFEEWMPYLGTTILLCTVLMLVLSIPPFLREHALAHDAPGGDPFSRASQERVARLLPNAGLPDGTDVASLASEKTLREGRRVVLDRCTVCHDLRTILERPRTPQNWWTTVERMGDKPALFAVMDSDDLLAATAYLVAITPDLQRSLKRRRADEEAQQDTLDDVEAIDQVPVDDEGEPVDGAPAGTGGPLDAGLPLDAVAPVADGGTPDRDAGASTSTDAAPAKPAPPPVDPARARAVYERRCSECHELSDVVQQPPRTRTAVRSLIRRMVENGMEASRSELALIRWWLEREYVRGASAPRP